MSSATCEMLPRNKVARRRCAKACWSCKRRKERCDSNRPCGRCVLRGLGDRCGSVDMSHTMNDPVVGDLDNYFDIDSNGRSSQSPRSSGDRQTTQYAEVVSADIGDSNSSGPPLGTTPLNSHAARLIPNGQGEFTFIGDAANLTFLQTIRQLFCQSVGSCEFTDDLFRHILVEAPSPGRKNWMSEAARSPPPIPTVEETVHFLDWYCRATNCILNVFNEADLRKILLEWQQKTPECRNDDPMGPVFFLVLAVGAQASPRDFDTTAERYFGYGAYLTATSGLMDTVGILTVMANLLVTMYLLGASRREAAYLAFGSVVRATYALGIHRRDINELLGQEQYTTRERLWKVTRVLDAFMGASLGRPPSTTETRDTQAAVDYSPSSDLCSIFETILTQVYSNCTVSADVLRGISSRHRTWATRFSSGLAVDDIQPNLSIKTSEGKLVPNIGLYHLKEAYYWAIMLLTRPFLVDIAATRMEQSEDCTDPRPLMDTSSPNYIMAHACVDSAIRTVDLLRVLDSSEGVPKRLPFVVNSLFHSALVLGLAELGGLDHALPVRKCLVDAQRLLSRFSRHDTVAQRDLLVVESLHDACVLHAEKRTQQTMAKSSARIGGLFGAIHEYSNRRSPVVEAGSGHPARHDAHMNEQTDSGQYDYIDEFIRTQMQGGDPDLLQNFSESNQQNMEVLPDFDGMSDLFISSTPATGSFNSHDDIMDAILNMRGDSISSGRAQHGARGSFHLSVS